MNVDHRLRISGQNTTDDEAALDRLIESALAEGELSDAAPAAGQSWSDPDLFLAQAAEFLIPRPDRADLIERLRALIEPVAGREPAEAETKPE